MTVNISNTDLTHDAFVSVADRNAPPSAPPIPDQRINRGQTLPYTNITADGNGNCLLDINVVDTADPSHTKAFPGQVAGDGGTINIDLF